MMRFLKIAPKYRIVSRGYWPTGETPESTESVFYAQKKILNLFWVDCISGIWSLGESPDESYGNCLDNVESWVCDQIRDWERRNQPQRVIKTYSLGETVNQ